MYRRAIIKCYRLTINHDSKVQAMVCNCISILQTHMAILVLYLYIPFT